MADAVARRADAGSTPTTCSRLAQRKVLLYDKAGEEHFNLISALHKSLRESDADAALYWLARMLAAGEDPLYLARRMVRFASEDVGLADPQALPPRRSPPGRPTSGSARPEGELALAQAAVYLALAPEEQRASTRASGEAPPHGRGAAGRPGAAGDPQRADPR